MSTSVPESQPDESRVLIENDDEPVVVPKELPTPPPYPSTSSLGIPPHPRCNHLLEHRNKKGTWLVDTALSIPESLLPPMTEFDGHWNEDVRSLRTGNKPSESEVRPNLMLVSQTAAISGSVHVLGEGKDKVVIVAEAKTSGLVHLDVNADPGRVLQIFLHSHSGEVRLWVPSWFEGPLVTSAYLGDINVSDALKSKLTVFTSKANQSRGYIGDWQSSGFGTTQSSGEDPFTTWPGSMIKISSGSGSVFLSTLEEKPSSVTGTSAPAQVKGFFGSIFGWGESDQDESTSRHQRRSSGRFASRSSFDEKELPPRPSEGN
ncbi:hypothetical protein RhiJN_10867 [Ceratobasidium sp. AG-Ba]|nr:hypothetical protein RhiJN_10867 [Ceratobasidium sp. AG-Ba]